MSSPANVAMDFFSQMEVFKMLKKHVKNHVQQEINLQMLDFPMNP